MALTTQALLEEIQALLPAVQELHVLGSDACPPVLMLVYVGTEAIGGYGVTREEASADLRRTVALWVTTPLDGAPGQADDAQTAAVPASLAEATRRLLRQQQEGS